MRWRRTAEKPTAPAPAPAPAAGFIGRAAEQQVFRDLLREVAGGHSAFVHVQGTGRSGRRALLGQFRVLAAEAGARCAPVIDFEDDAAVELDELLERLAGGLEREPEHFKRFLETAKRFRSREAGQPTRTSQAVAAVRAGSSAVSQLAGAFPVKAINTAIQSPLGDVLTEHAETKRTLTAVTESFVDGLLELAQAGGPVVLVFSQLDFGPSSAKLLWLRRSLLPRVARARVIVAVSSEPQFELAELGMLFGRMEELRLERFTMDEAEQFLTAHVRLEPASALGRAVLEDSDCFPERLAGYAQYFAEHPAARDGDRLPTEARDLTAGGLASGLLSRVPDPFLRDVLLHAAPLRWFNAELLGGVEEVCKLGADGAAPGGAARLLDLELRPSWVTNVGGGWGIDVPARRRAIVDEFRRLHPRLYRRVHLHAARYHLTRLRELEGGVEAENAVALDDTPVFDYEPSTHPTDRLRWDEYLASLGEWLYHLVALSPRLGFARLADHVGEALAWGHPEVAIALLDIGVEIPLPGAEVLVRQRVLEAARAMRAGRHAETLQLLDEFVAAGSASAIADGAACFLAGVRLDLLGRSSLRRRERFERAERLLAGAGDGVQAASLRCLNLTRLAREQAGRVEGTAQALELLDHAATLAAPLDPRMQAEVARTRGSILADAGQAPEALAACDGALELLGRAGAAAEAALVLCLRADIDLHAGAGDAARRDLVSARSIYRQLVDPVAEAQVVVGLLEIALHEGDEPAAAEHEAAIIALRPDDFVMRNQLGNRYFHAGRHEHAVAHYGEALALAEEAAVFANRGRARLAWADQLDQDDAATNLRKLGRDDLATTCELDPDDLDSGIRLAELERRLGDGAAAAAAGERVATRALDAARELPAPPPGAPDPPERAAAVGRLRDLFVRGVTLLGPAPAARLLAGWVASMPGDEELDLMSAIAGDELSGDDPGALTDAIGAAERAVAADDPPRGRALVELAALRARARNWTQAKDAAERAMQDETVRVQAEYMLDRLDQMHRRDDEFGGEAETIAEELVVDIAEDLRRWFDPESPVGSEFFGWMIESFRRARRERAGLPPPGLWVGVRRELRPGRIHVVIDNRVRARIDVAGALLADVAPAECKALTGVAGDAARRPWDDGPATWLPASAAGALERAGVTFWDPRGLVLAALDTVLEASPRFVSAEAAASLSGESWAELEPEEYLARAAIVRELLDARVPSTALPGILAAHRAAEPAQRPAILAEAIARLSVPVIEARALAAAFARTTFQPPRAGADGGGPRRTHVLVGVGDAEAPEPALGAARTVVDAACGALAVPPPELRVEHDPALGAGGIAVTVAGVTRLVCAPADALDWWRLHPVAGAGGRAGVPATDVAGRAGRALEAVLWDDPALLMGDAEDAKEAFAALLGTAPSDQVTTALLEVLGRRLPLGAPAKLKQATERLNPRSRTGLERLPPARTYVSSPRRPVPDNLPFGIRDTLHVDEGGRLRQFAVRLLLHHDNETDLHVTLTAPSGTTVVLHDFGEDLDRLRSGVDQDQVPALAPLLNQHAEGDWTIHVQDVSSGDAGLLEQWAIELTTVATHGGDEPATPAPAIALTDREVRALGRCSSLERDLRSRRIEAHCGAGLWSALEVDVADGRLAGERVRLGTHLARELGLRFGHSTHFQLDPQLPEHGFRVVINGLTRASGELPPGRYGRAPGAGDAGADVWVGPLSGATQHLLPDGAPGGFDAPDRLMRHIRAAAREAASEFADADWATAFLDRIEHTFPVTIPAVRTAAGDDLLAAVLRELVTQGITVADPRLMDLIPSLVRSPELAAECERLAAAPPRHVGRTAGAMAEWLRERLELGDPDPDVLLLELGPEIEAAVGSAVGSSDGRVPVYALPDAGRVLRRLEQARAGRGGAEIAVVTAARLRRHVHRLIAAQLPTVEVLARERLDPVLPRQLVDLGD